MLVRLSWRRGDAGGGGRRCDVLGSSKKAAAFTSSCSSIAYFANSSLSPKNFLIFSLSFFDWYRCSTHNIARIKSTNKNTATPRTAHNHAGIVWKTSGPLMQLPELLQYWEMHSRSCWHGAPLAFDGMQTNPFRSSQYVPSVQLSRIIRCWTAYPSASYEI